MTEAQIKSVALFFFFSFADKSVAFSASTEAIHFVEKRQKKLKLEEVSNSVLVLATYRVWKKFSKRKKKLLVSDDKNTIESGWLVPEGIRLEYWWQFLKESESTTRLALVWSVVLGFSDQEIAIGMNISEGTVRYRVGQALKHLGTIAVKTSEFP